MAFVKLSDDLIVNDSQIESVMYYTDQSAEVRMAGGYVHIVATLPAVLAILFEDDPEPPAKKGK